MKASEARKLIGKRISWEVRDSRWVSHKSAVLAEVRGKNVRTAEGDWLWLPSIPAAYVVEDA